MASTAQLAHHQPLRGEVGAVAVVLRPALAGAGAHRRYQLLTVLIVGKEASREP